MSITRKQHVSKSGKSILAFRRQPVIGSSGVIPRQANSTQGEDRPRPLGGPAVRIDAASSPFFVRLSPQEE
ncbi:MAG TPA: hypothetical protein VMA71_08120 [Alloacidobacterium sp.]|nr:hypothetical protein [Alloacidobacterium sp.]